MSREKFEEVLEHLVDVISDHNRKALEAVVVSEFELARTDRDDFDHQKPIVVGLLAEATEHLAAVSAYISSASVSCGMEVLRLEQRFQESAREMSQKIDDLKAKLSEAEAKFPDDRKPIHKAIREEVWLKTDGACVYCGTGLIHPNREAELEDNLEDGAFMEIDHVIPASRGGPHSLVNYVPSCRSCNQTKRARDPVEFIFAVRKLAGAEE